MQGRVCSAVVRSTGNISISVLACDLPLSLFQLPYMEILLSSLPILRNCCFPTAGKLASNGLPLLNKKGMDVSGNHGNMAR